MEVKKIKMPSRRNTRVTSSIYFSQYKLLTL